MPSKTQPKATAEKTPDPAVTEETPHKGWAHDWRNPAAKFASDDHCPDAELARMDRGKG